jgi:hypothetical protein
MMAFLARDLHMIALPLFAAPRHLPPSLQLFLAC